MLNPATRTRHTIFLVIFMILAAAPVRSETLTLVTAANTVDTLTSEVIVREAYKRLGIDVEIKKFPGERALKMANDDKVAGDVQRIDTACRPRDENPTSGAWCALWGIKSNLF